MPLGDPPPMLAAPVPGPPSGASAGSTATAAAISGGTERAVTIQDACDPATFNAALGADSCLRSGGVVFDRFIELLRRHGSIGSWRFSPVKANATMGQTMVAINRGGEVHTFTEVAAFGGGVVPMLNELSGNAKVAPECMALNDDDFVAPGARYKEVLDDDGTVRFQCCIHPWMRLEARVTER
jgi:plastocyanin